MIRVNEALHLTEKEKETIFGLFKNTEDELSPRLGHFSQDVMIRHIELLLNYNNRFITPGSLLKKQSTVTSSANWRLYREHILTIRTAWKMTCRRYSFVCNLAGLNAQQHVHQKLIEKAGTYLSAAQLTVAGIAYQPGLEHLQSFHKLFKKNSTPS